MCICQRANFYWVFLFPMKNVNYYLAAITASTIWGFFSFVLRPLAAWSSVDILFYRVFTSAVLLLVASTVLRAAAWKAGRLKYSELSISDKRGLIRQVLGGGLFLTANWFFFIFVLNHRSIKAASLAYLVCPILTTLLAWMILKERLLRSQWVAVGMSVCGCMLLAFHHLADLLYSLIIAISYAFYLISQRKNFGIDKFLLLTVQVIFSALLLLPFYPFYRGPVPTVPLFYILITVIAVFYTIIPLWLSLFALQRLKSSTVGIILYINPLLGFVIAVACYGEKVDILQGNAYGIIVLAILLFNWQSFFGPDRVKLDQMG
jgi:chloramphenicol-sensitive protein RarD